tara:strand:+ start:602 stop:919 length:318 start_codon:yes stop_codon:yes gene_type:complete
VENHLPSITTKRVEQINASAAPKKTISGFPDSADKRSVAICVLSPNSARKTLIKVEIRILNKPLELSGGLISEMLFVCFSGEDISTCKSGRMKNLNHFPQTSSYL